MRLKKIGKNGGWCKKSLRGDQTIPRIPGIEKGLSVFRAKDKLMLSEGES